MDQSRSAAAVDFGTVTFAPILHGVVASVLYFLVGVTVLIGGFVMVDLLTPGNLRHLVFLERRPNAVVLASALYAALATIIVVAIYTSSSQLGEGLLGVAVYGTIGILLQGLALLILRVVVPGNLYAHVEDPELHPAAFATAAMLLAIGAVTAASLS
ncbi:hypothetical protein BST27_28990 [Mycobacterium intermedium]|uniref:DUF350 domain-containing protein n=1 Tax=Mycobacterium intermedium TaxID=28445 RepID=A0A1E3S3S1_MYCIE|nr:DUF350 domain-containing protein [Mycobacterium intermedium]MCV6966374.1 DUF350 domain-containing protein [Mycobacterium intermedium]ODQ96760.1 hypothetical protein BHQ20_28575 [Mycobacterium intermedium]OPE45745.1 hypothetical protein BV508_28540 [Mycobacterium intermedium]ORA93291.1 hypothetical protein BST27_28990 [Mycobacterium intermedium]